MIRKGQADRECLETALAEVVAERSFGGATVTEVCARAGVDRPVFERHFSDLEDGLCAYFETQTAVLLTRSVAVFEREASWAEELRAVAYTLLEFLQEDRVRAWVMMVEALGAGDRARLVRDQGMKALTMFIDAGRAELDDPESLSPAIAEAIAGTIFNQILFEIERDRFETLTGLVPKMMYSAVLPYLGPEAAARELERPAPAGVGLAANVDIS